ncbi:MAG: formylglycine-generating enzyme family protein [Candidatus Handelsmanbacteria bacterium]|nr:formylglycine-generating enzyme family protein [Candidatus Handelsmanbacteria bacterium]
MVGGAALLAGFWLWTAAAAASYGPVVTNVLAKQRPGTKLVDITCDVQYAGSGPMVISVQVSADRGRTWQVPVRSLSGDVGRGIRAGTGKHIVWDAGADLPHAFGADYRPRVIAESTEPGEPGAVVERELSAALPGGVTMEFVWVEPGFFLMGAAPGEKGRSSDEAPQHEKEIGRGFYLGRFEVTQAQWEAVMVTRPWADGVYVLDQPECPAVNISWLDVHQFIHRLNEAAGDSLYRLRTEAEWEYACRAGTTTRWSYSNAESQLTAYAWFYENTWHAGSIHAQPVGTMFSNPWGLYDMHGNVWEWRQDWFEFYAASKAPAAGSRVVGRRVMRGGGFGNDASHLRSADRAASDPGTCGHDLGARLVRIR